MGYYTNYSLSVTNADDDVIKAIERTVVDEWGLTRWVDGEWYASEVKWYYHDDDMLKLSALFPDVLFDLYGQGEDSEDMWHTYYKNGMMQHCPARIEFDPYDESKLQ